MKGEMHINLFIAKKYKLSDREYKYYRQSKFKVDFDKHHKIEIAEFILCCMDDLDTKINEKFEQEYFNSCSYINT